MFFRATVLARHRVLMRISPQPRPRRDRITARPRQSLSAQRAAAGRSRGRCWHGARRPADAGPGELVRAAVQGVRQSLLAGDAPAFLVGALNQRRDHHHRHQLRLGDRARDHRGSYQARSESARHQVRDHQSCARRSRSGPRGVAEALWRAGGVMGSPDWEATLERPATVVRV
jgi:hypothetical protein